MRRLVKSLKVDRQRSLSLLCLFVALIGCTDQRIETTSFSEPVYSKQYRQQAITAIITLSETNIPTSGKIRLMLDVHAPADTPVEIPDIGSAVHPFTVADGYSEPVQILPNSKQLHRRVWVLIPALPGSTDFQPLEILAGAETLTTAPIQVHVESLLPPGTDTFEIKDIAEPVSLLPEQEKMQRSLYLIMGALLSLGVILYAVYRSRKPTLLPLEQPHETAFLALGNLPDDPLERIHELNRIFRTYFEARFNLPMVGRTTAEILPILEDMEVIHFLENCEGIRFSNKIPSGFAEESEQFVHHYIEQTMEVPECD